MTFPGPGRAEEVQHFGAPDELKLRQRHDAVAIQRGLEEEVEAFEGLDRPKACSAYRDTDPAPLSELLRQRGIGSFMP